MKRDGQSSSQAIPPELLASSKGRSALVVVKLQKAMREMELEVEQHDGLYPLNGGRITVAEVCRRAGVSEGTLHTSTHRKTTRSLVSDWVKGATAAVIQGSKRIRRVVTDRADDWKKAHGEIATAYHIGKLEVVDLKAALADAGRRIADLEQTNATLLSQLDKISSSNVARLPPRKR